MKTSNLDSNPTRPRLLFNPSLFFRWQKCMFYNFLCKELFFEQFEITTSQKFTNIYIFKRYTHIDVFLKRLDTFSELVTRFWACILLVIEVMRLLGLSVIKHTNASVYNT